MRRILFVVALLTALVPGAGTPASAQVIPSAQFSGYSTGTAVHADLLKSGDASLVDTEIAFSGANVDTDGLGAALTNEMDQAFQPVAGLLDKSSGQGSGLEVGLFTPVPNAPNANQLIPGGVAQAFAPPSSELINEELLDLNLDPLINVRLLRGQAQPIYDNNVCVLGQAISYGMGYVADVNLLNFEDRSLLATDPGALSQSESFTYLIPNGDGTYGLVTESHQILAPVTLFKGSPRPLVIEFLGQWVLRSTATGKPGGATVEYAPAGSPTSTTPVITVRFGDDELLSLSTQDLLGQDGFVLPLDGLGLLAIGEDARSIGGGADSDPTMTGDGTMAAAAVDVVRLLVGQGDGESDGHIADLRIGHMEAQAIVPAGGIECGIPVSKTGTPASIVAGSGELMTYTISIPSDVEAFGAVACDLTDMKVTDVTTAGSGVLFDIVSASNDGVIGLNTVTWDDLGTYRPGDAPIVLTVTLRVPVGSAAGTITDTATATGVLSNCQGNASANATTLTGLAKLEAGALNGSDNFGGRATTTVLPAVSANTEETEGATSVLGITLDNTTPVGGVATGAGGTTHRSGPLMVVGAGLGSLALVGLVTSRRRRRIG